MYIDRAKFHTLLVHNQPRSRLYPTDQRDHTSQTSWERLSVLNKFLKNKLTMTSSIHFTTVTRSQQPLALFQHSGIYIQSAGYYLITLHKKYIYGRSKRLTFVQVLSLQAFPKTVTKSKDNNNIFPNLKILNAIKCFRILDPWRVNITLGSYGKHKFDNSRASSKKHNSNERCLTGTDKEHR